MGASVVVLHVEIFILWIASERVEFFAPFIKCVRDVFQEEKTEDDVLILGDINVASELVGSRPELLFEVEVVMMAFFDYIFCGLLLTFANTLLKVSGKGCLEDEVVTPNLLGGHLSLGNLLVYGRSRKTEHFGHFCDCDELGFVD